MQAETIRKEKYQLPGVDRRSQVLYATTAEIYAEKRRK
jgi:hypothetical protein